MLWKTAVSPSKRPPTCTSLATTGVNRKSLPSVCAKTPYINMAFLYAHRHTRQQLLKSLFAPPCAPYLANPNSFLLDLLRPLPPRYLPPLPQPHSQTSRIAHSPFSNNIAFILTSTPPVRLFVACYFSFLDLRTFETYLGAAYP